MRATMTDWMMAEYKALKDEIAQKLKLQNDLLTFAVTTSIGLGALGVSAEGADARELRVRAEGLPEKVRFRCVVADAAGARAESEAVAYAPEKR